MKRTINTHIPKQTDMALPCLAYAAKDSSITGLFPHLKLEEKEEKEMMFSSLYEHQSIEIYHVNNTLLLIY